MKFPKPKRIADPEYLDFVRSRGCIVCGGESDAHHLTTRAAFGSDYTCIPLCRIHHSELHQLGEKKFEERWRLRSVWWWSNRILASYVREVKNE